MPATPAAVEEAFLKRVANLGAVTKTLDYEPGPRQLKVGDFPCVCLLYLGESIEADPMGPLQEMGHHWDVGIYVELGDYREAQHSLRELVPALFGVVRPEPRLIPGVTIELDDPLRKPLPREREGWMRKELRLVAYGLEG